MSTSCSKNYTITIDSPITVDAYWTLDEAAPGPNPVSRIDSVHGIALNDNSFGGNPGVPGLYSLGLPRTWNASNGDFSTFNETVLSYNGTSGFSYFGWFKINVESAAGNPGVVISINFNNSGNQIALELANVFGGQANMHLSWNANTSSTSGDLFQSVSVGSWHFYHVFYDSVSQVVGFSVDNGINQTSSAGQIFSSSLNGNLDISGSSANGLDLILDETGIKVSAKLTSSEVSFLWNSGAGRTWPL